MAESSVNMVLRTVYLPLELDKELRQLAISRDVSKGELMRDFILRGLRDMEARDGKSLAKRLTQRHFEGKVAVTANAKPKSTAKATLPASKAAKKPARRARTTKGQPQRAATHAA